MYLRGPEMVSPRRRAYSRDSNSESQEGVGQCGDMAKLEYHKVVPDEFRPVVTTPHPYGHL